MDESFVEARRLLFLHAPYWGYLSLMVRLVPREDLLTGATDGRALYVRPEYVALLSPAQQAGMLVHLLLHAARHDGARQDLDPARWNLACDVVLHRYVVGLSWADLVPGAVHLPEHTGSAEEVYARLPREGLPFCPHSCFLARPADDHEDLHARWHLIRCLAEEELHALSRSAMPSALHTVGLSLYGSEAEREQTRAALVERRGPPPWGEEQLESIVAGTSTHPFPEDPIDRLRLCLAVAATVRVAAEGIAAFHWITRHSGDAYVRAMMTRIAERLRLRGLSGQFAVMAQRDAQIRAFLQRETTLYRR